MSATQLGPLSGCTYPLVAWPSEQPSLQNCKHSIRPARTVTVSNKWSHELVWWRHGLPSLVSTFNALRAQMTFSSCNYLRTAAPWCQFSVSIYFKNTQNIIFFFLHQRVDNLAYTLDPHLPGSVCTFMRTLGEDGVDLMLCYGSCKQLRLLQKVGCCKR